MVGNDAIILNNLLKQKKQEIAQDLSDFEYFRLFTFEQSLKNFELEYDDLLFGDIDGGDDGGIDGFFFFINSELIKEEINPDDFKKKPELNVFLIQSKSSTSFKEDVLQKIITTINDIFDLSKDMTALSNFYNSDLIEKASCFRKAFVGLASKHPILNIHFSYASNGDASTIHPKINNQATLLKGALEKLFRGANIQTHFLGAKELLDLSRVEKTYTLSLNFIENVLSKGENNYVLLTNIKDYYDFIVDESGNLRDYIFEANVRDFQGYVEVNQDIHKTLTSEKLDFWWLNNGITILASKATVAGKTITIDNVQIINGLQTTHCIYNYLNSKIKESTGLNDDDKTRSLLIKILVIKDEYAKDKIIKATNFQTSIPPASLKATDRIHHNLEDFFKSKDLFYDRRKNFYKNLGKPVNKIISISLLAQCINTIVNKDPHTSRSRPSTLIKTPVAYAQIFNDTIPPETYLFSAQVIKSITSSLKIQLDDYTSYEKTNLRFHISLIAVMIALNKKDYLIQDLKDMDISKITPTIINKAIKETVVLARKYSTTSNLSIDVISKSKAFSDYLKQEIIIP
jgi:hypothetical protein